MDDCGVKNGVAISLGAWYFSSVRDPAQVFEGHTSHCFKLPRHELNTVAALICGGACVLCDYSVHLE